MNRQIRWTALGQLLPRVALVLWLVASPVAARAEVFRYQPRGKAYVPKESVPCAAPIGCTTSVNGATPCPTCAGNDPNCGCRKRCGPCQNCKPPCKQPCPPPPEQPMYVPQPGVFVQPPASGTVRGPVSQYGLEGAEITFPALSLRLPSIRLPGVSRSRQNARMETDVALAPYVEMPAQPVYSQQQPVAAAPGPSMQMMAMPAPQMMMAPMQMPMMAPPAYAPPPVQAPPPPVAAPPQPPPDLPMTPAPPSCDARGVPMAAASAEEKIRQLEIIEQQLQNRLEQLRRQLEQAEASQRPPVPTPDLGARQFQPLQTPGVHPVSRPLAPLPPQAAPQQTKLYNERPASYTSEPQLLPQSYAQPIREPQGPAARITGLRTR